MGGIATEDTEDAGEATDRAWVSVISVPSVASVVLSGAFRPERNGRGNFRTERRQGYREESGQNDRDGRHVEVALRQGVVRGPVPAG